MTTPNAIFETHYASYLAELSGIDPGRRASILDITMEDERTVKVPYLGAVYRVSPDGVEDGAGHRPDYGTCVVLCRYLLMCPDRMPTDDTWVHYRDFKDAGPLTVFFSDNAERPVVRRFAGRLPELEAAAAALDAANPDLDLAYDVAARFSVLPRVPVILLFNDADDLFPAQCRMLFEGRAERFLDAETLAVIGAHLANQLIR